MRIIIVEKVKGEPSHPIEEKWRISAAVHFNETNATIELTRIAGGRPSWVADWAVAHERGHVELVEDMQEADLSARDASEVDRWQVEVDAWLRALDRPISFAEGSFILDCLYTYGYFLPSSREWHQTQDQLAEYGMDELTVRWLKEYKPLEPPPGGPPGDDCQLGEPHDDNSTDPPPGGFGRWNELSTPEAVQAATMGRERLRDYMRERGLGDELRDLPPVVEAIIGPTK